MLLNTSNLDDFKDSRHTPLIAYNGEYSYSGDFIDDQTYVFLV